MARVQMNSQRAVNTVVSHVPGVVDRVAKQARKIANKAEAIHMSYHDPDDPHESRFHVTHGEVDSFANLDHPAAFYREMGWIHPKSGKIIPGKHTMTKAAFE